MRIACVVYISFLSTLLHKTSVAKSVKSLLEKEIRPFRPFFRNGRVRGGMVGHWKEDWTDGKSEQESANIGSTIPGNPNVTIGWFDQKLDHFNQNDIRTWKQKYWMNDMFYKPGGPVFIMIGGEGPISRHWIDINEGTPDYLKNAKTFGAMAFQLEHRFYGESWPLPDMSTTNLQYLSSRQALADLNFFISRIRSIYPQIRHANFVTFGGSYSGALSGWFKLKYPGSVVGAVATSAPVFATLDFRQYLEVVGMSLASYSPMCSDMVRMGDQAVQNLLKSPPGQKTVEQKFRLCTPLATASKWDIKNLYSLLAGNFMGVVQYSRDNRGIYANRLTIPVVCGIMMNPSMPNVVDRYAAVNKLILDTSGETCLDFNYNNMINYLRVTNFTAVDSAARLWTWQTCTEFGFYQDSNSTMQPFSNTFPLSFWIKQCADIFGPSFTQVALSSYIRATNEYYGGRNFQGKNVIFPNGSLDPWHALSILNSKPGSSAVSAFILGTAHCANMYPARQSDLIGLNNVRNRITESLHAWLGVTDQISNSQK